MNNKTISGMKCILYLFGLLVLALPAQAALADDYVLDTNPRNYSGRADLEGEPFETAQDPNVCGLYLLNLRHFAKRNLPMSCGQPVAPTLMDKIKPVEWENLDPVQHPDLFKTVIKEARTRDKEPSSEELNRRRIEIREGGVVFRRLKFDFKGSPGVEEGSNRPLPEQELSIVQYGNAVTSPENPNSTWRCHSRKSRTMDVTINTQLDLFIVTKDLTRIYSSLQDWKGYSGQNMWLINDRIYGERYDEKGDVKLTELRVAFPIHLESVCLYHFKKTSHKE